MKLNYHVIEAISNVYITFENFIENLFGDSPTLCLINCNAMKSVNDVLNIKGMHCPTDIFNWHLEYLEKNNIIGRHEEKGYYLIRDKDVPVSQTSTKIYSFIYNLQKDKHNKPKLNMFGIKANGEKIKTSIILEDVLDEEDVDSSHNEYELVDNNTYDEPEKYVSVSQTTKNTYYDIEVVNGNIQCSCNAFYYNPTVYCKHIKELQNKFKSGVVLKQSYPTISNIICKPSVQISVKVPEPKDICLHTFICKKYDIKIYNKRITCTCTDFQYRGPLRFCKHMQSIVDSYTTESIQLKIYFDNFKSKCEC
jgi:hypothetical protein